MCYLSQHAKNLIKVKYQKRIFLKVYEDTNYDMYGPKSEIWDLYIYYETSDGNKMIDNWHWEKWGHIEKTDNYISRNDCTTYSLEEFRSTIYFIDRIASHLNIL